jgi:hypothetical protein
VLKTITIIIIIDNRMKIKIRMNNLSAKYDIWNSLRRGISTPNYTQRVAVGWTSFASYPSSFTTSLFWVKAVFFSEIYPCFLPVRTPVIQNFLKKKAWRKTEWADWCISRGIILESEGSRFYTRPEHLLYILIEHICWFSSVVSREIPEEYLH